jgi:hypothetical protein
VQNEISAIFKGRPAGTEYYLKAGYSDAYTICEFNLKNLSLFNVHYILKCCLKY